MKMDPSKTVYTALYKTMRLNDNDLESLKKDRGFSQVTINDLGFKSSGSYLAEIINKLKDKIPVETLYRVGLLNEKEQPAWQFTNDGMIIIPFFDDEKNVYHYHSHKQGALANVAPKPYCSYIIDVNKKYVVLTESAFKAAALWQLGINAIGLNGVSVFAGEHYKQLQQMIEPFGHVFVLFDTEIQHDPTNDAYKNDVSKMYAHIVWAYIMGKKIEEHNIAINQAKIVKIARLPKEDCVSGKIDIDKALALGKDRQYFDTILEQAVTLDYFKKTIDVPEQHKHYVYRRITQRDITFKIQDNSYYKIKMVKDDQVEIRVSNFIINLTANVHTAEGLMRMINLESDIYEKSSDFVVKASDLSSAKSFKEICLSHGNFIWFGNDTDLTTLVHDVIDTSKYIEINMYPSIGRNGDYWIFKNYAFYGGIRFEPSSYFENNPVYRINERGHTYTKSNCSKLPMINGEHGSMPIGDVAKLFEQSWGFPGVIAFLYTLSCFFSEDMHEHYQCFPFLFLYGEKSSGKTSLADTIVGIFGIPSNANVYNIGLSTVKGLEQIAYFYSSIPVIFDEYRNDDQNIRGKLGWLRSAYNRQESGRSNKERNAFNTFVPKSPFIIVGEDSPEDAALESRCVQLSINKRLRGGDSYKYFKQIRSMRDDLDFIALNVFRKFDDYKSNFLKEIKKELKENDSAEERYSLFSSMLIATNNVFGLSYKEKIKEYSGESKSEQLENNLIIKFFNYVYDLIPQGLVDGYMFINRENNGNKLFIYLPLLVDIVLANLARTRKPDPLISRKNIRDYLKGYSFVGLNPQNIHFPGVSMSFKNSYSFDLEDIGCFQIIKDIADNVLNQKNNCHILKFQKQIKED